MKTAAATCCITLLLAGNLVAAEKATGRAVRGVTPAPAAAPPTSAPNGQAFRTWTDTEGRTVVAAFCGMSGEFVTLQTRDGRILHLELPLFSRDDRQVARELAAKTLQSGFNPATIAQAVAELDRLVDANLASRGVAPNPPSTDEQFLRRIYIDAVGRIPTAGEAAAFLDDRSPDKRARLIDRLVYSRGYSQQMYNWMADLLRVKDKFGRGVPSFTFEDWLKSRLEANAPWDALVREMLTARGSLLENGAAGYLIQDAEMPLDRVSYLMTTFLGSNMACAQCHDHPLADWKQRQFYEIAGFLGATESTNRDVVRTIARIAKENESLPKVQVRLLGELNAAALSDVAKMRLTLPANYRYDDAKPGSAVKPTFISWDDDDRSLAIYKLESGANDSLRDRFARWLTSPENPRFATNIANRIWKKNFGLAVQEPVGDIDDLGGGSSPELLAHLTAIMRQAHFDLREFQRVLYNSKAYQRAASAYPDLEKGPYAFPGPLIRRLSAEQAWDSLVTQAIGGRADNILLRRGEDLEVLALPKGKITLETIEAALKASRQMADRKSGEAKKGSGGSNFGLSGGYQGERPDNRFGLLLARASELPQPAAESHFLRLFGQGDRQLPDSSTSDGSIPQVLMLMNGAVGQVMADTRSFAVMAAASQRSPQAQVTSLYLSTLSRRPTPAELAAATQAMAKGATLGDVAWALANTREFLFIR